MEQLKQNKMLVVLIIVLICGSIFLWMYNVGYPKIKSALAHEQPGTSGNDPGDFSEEWIATEITGDVLGYDGWSLAYAVPTQRASMPVNTLNGVCGIGDTWKYSTNTFEYWAVPGSDAATKVATNNANCQAKDGSGRWQSRNNSGNGILIGAEQAGVVNLVTKWKVNGHIH